MASSEDGMPRATIIAALIGAIGGILAAALAAWIGLQAGERTGQQQAQATATVQQVTSLAEAARMPTQTPVTKVVEATHVIEVTRIVEITSTPGPTQTVILAVVPSPTQEPTPIPTPTGTVLYQANESGGMEAWPANGSWKIIDKMLVNDGNTGGSGGAVIMAPFEPEAVDLDNYTVEAEIQLIKGFCYGSFGIIVRSGYRGGINSGVCSGRDYSASISLGDRYFPLEAVRYDPGTEWRTYRLEVRGNKIQFFIGGARVLEIQDNTHTTGGEVGLWSEVGQINVRSFKVISCNSC